MSKLVDKLKLNSKVMPQPMGFRAISTQQKPRLLIIAAAASPAQAKDYSSADAVLIKVEDGPVKKIDQSLEKEISEIPLGIQLKQNSKKDAFNSGIDFVVMPITSFFSTLKQIGIVLGVESSLSDSILRSVDELPVEGFLLNYSISNQISWNDLAEIQRVAGLLSKPLLFPAPPDLTDDDLQALWRAGISALIIEASSEGIKILKEQIEKLNFPLPRKPRKLEVTVPVVSGASNEIEEPEEPEEEPEREE